jgi:hypothetical protein
MIYHNTARNSDHKTHDCLILKKLGLKLVKRLESDSNIDAALRVTAPPALESAKPAAATPAPSSDTVSGLASLPGGFSAQRQSKTCMIQGMNPITRANQEVPCIWVVRLNLRLLVRTQGPPHCVVMLAAILVPSPTQTHPTRWGVAPTLHLTLFCAPRETPKMSRLFISPKQSWLLSRTLKHTNVTPRLAMPTLHSSWPTRGPQILCCLTKQHSYPTIQLKVVACGWAITPLPQSLGKAQQLSL